MDVKSHLKAYNLTICSQLPLPELLDGTSGRQDVLIRLGSVDPPPQRPASLAYWVCLLEDRVYLHWDVVGTFLIQGGTEIVIDPAPAVDESLLRLVLLSSPLAVLLQQRHLLVLHGSAIAAHGLGVAFLGGKRSGKSTLAAAMYRRGYSVLADDIVALDYRDPKAPLLLPGFPRLKLWPEAAELLGYSPGSLPCLHPHTEKRSLRVADRFQETPLPLGRLYILEEGPRLTIERMSSQEAFVAFIRHSYALQRLQRPVATRSHFCQSASLADRRCSWWLRREQTLSALPHLVDRVERELESPSIDASG